MVLRKAALLETGTKIRLEHGVFQITWVKAHAADGWMQIGISLPSPDVPTTIGNATLHRRDFVEVLSGPGTRT